MENEVTTGGQWVFADCQWLQPFWRRWQDALMRGHKPHAVLVHGLPGVGKSLFTEHAMATLLCRDADDAPCGVCRNCLLYASGNHPDVHRVAPDGALIKVDQVRQLTRFFNDTPHCSEHKLAVIVDAGRMNASAANALLKTLEEPPARATLFILTDEKERLLPTIRSRCVPLHLSCTVDQAMLDWLAALGLKDRSRIARAQRLVGDAPLALVAALRNHEIERLEAALEDLTELVQRRTSLVAVAQKWLDSACDQILLGLQRQLIDWARASMRGAQEQLDHALLRHRPVAPRQLMQRAMQIDELLSDLNGQLKKEWVLEAFLFDLDRDFNNN